MKLIYVAAVRIPTEKAHGLQIMQNCEALAAQRTDVTLWLPRRINTPALRGVTDPWAHYGVQRNFGLRYWPCIDLQPWAFDIPLLRRLTFGLQMVTFLLLVLLAALRQPGATYYSRDLAAVLLLTLIGRRVAYEPHRLSRKGWPQRLQARAVRQAVATFPVTQMMRQTLIEGGGDAARIHTAPDGIRYERFAYMPTQAEARARIGWPADAFIVGYVGRLHTLSMDKGVGTLVQALRDVQGAALGLVGGPDDMAAALRDQWQALGLADADFLYSGQVSTASVPLYLSAFDVCVMPFPWTTHFAYYASPLKLFEYMASGRAIIASDLPSTTEIVADGAEALLFPPDDVAALTAALVRLRDDVALRSRLGTQARQQALAKYTWSARAHLILDQLKG